MIVPCDEAVPAVSDEAVPAVNDEAVPGVSDQAVPALRVVRGRPTDDEVAAITAIVSAVASDAVDAEAEGPPAGPSRRGRWNDPAATHRRSWLVGPGGWQAAR